jgi:hypothetical protein
MLIRGQQPLLDGYHNEISPLEEKLRKFVFSGDEADEQVFIYCYTKPIIMIDFVLVMALISK